MKRLATLLLVLAATIPASPAASQKLVPTRIAQPVVASGPKSNTTAHEQVVFSQVVDVGKAPWVRVFLQSTVLKRGSYVRVTSLADGSSQRLDARQLGEWNYSTLRFRGGTVKVELVAAPGTSGNSVTVSQVKAGIGPNRAGPPEIQKVCGNVDSRRRSFHPAVARLTIDYKDGSSAFGTGWIIEEHDNLKKPEQHCMLSAGHIFEGAIGGIVEFDVPLSDADCAPNSSDARHTFPIQMGSVDFRLNGPGDDWAVFFPGRNENGETAFEVQNAAVTVSPGVAVGTRICKYGYGVVGLGSANPDSNFCACDTNVIDNRQRLNLAQTRSCGTVLAVNGPNDPDLKSNSVDIVHDLDTCGGDSGGLITLESDSTVAVAIHITGSCNGANNQNGATGLDNPRLQEAIRACEDNFPAPPGTPVVLDTLVVQIREKFGVKGGEDDTVAVPVGHGVVPGFVVLKEDKFHSDDDPANWSDVLWFPPLDSVAILISDPAGAEGFSDAILAPFGLSVDLINHGNTRYIAEQRRFTQYDCFDTTGAVAIYRIYSDVDTLLPGTPLNGDTSVVRIREEFGSKNDPVTWARLPGPVQPGYLVLVEPDATGPVDDPRGWSDVVDFGAAAGFAAMVSDADGGGPGITDQDLAPLGITLRNIAEGNTWFVVEDRPFVFYKVFNPYLRNPIPTTYYAIYSDQDTLPPGAPLPGTHGFRAGLAENFPDPQEPRVGAGLPGPGVQPGFVVLLEDSTAAPEDSTNWSDIVWYPPAPLPPQMIMVSDRECPAGGECGIAPSDLAALGFTFRNVREGNTVYLVERMPFNVYPAINFATGDTARYEFTSDIPEPTPVQFGNVIVESGYGYVDVRWQTILTTAEKFRVMRAASAGGDYQAVGADIEPQGRTSFVYHDVSVQAGAEYYYKIGYLDSGKWGYTTPLRALTPAQAIFAVRGIIPNPTPGATRVDFEVPSAGRALVEIYNVAGERVKTLLDGAVKAGPNSVTWDGRSSKGNLTPPGTYFVRLTVGDQRRSAKISVTR